MEEKYKAKPEKLPEPTYWPIFLALGVVCLFWGILTSWFISGIGLIIGSISLCGWLSDIYNELKDKDKDGLQLRKDA